MSRRLLQKHLIIIENLKGTGQKTKDLAYRTIVRPKLEYCSTVWDPYTQELVDMLQAVK